MSFEAVDEVVDLDPGIDAAPMPEPGMPDTGQSGQHDNPCLLYTSRCV